MMVWTWIWFACVPPKPPALLQSTTDGLEGCPFTNLVPWREQLAKPGLSGVARDALLRNYQRALVTWAACASVLEVERWSVPEPTDPPALAALEAALAPALDPVRRARGREASPYVPQAVALLVLDEFAVLEDLETPYGPALAFAGQFSGWTPGLARPEAVVAGVEALIAPARMRGGLESEALDAFITQRLALKDAFFSGSALPSGKETSED